MNSDGIYDALERIAGESGKNAKQEMVRMFGQAPEFRRALRAALDDSVTYGLAKMPPFEADGDEATFDEETWALLERLAKRELTGNKAKHALVEELAGLSFESAELLKRIITKDLRAGFTANTVNRVWPGEIPTFDCQLAHPFEAKRVERFPVYLEPKIDGVRVLAFVTISPTPTVKFYSRSGKEFTTFDHLKQPLIDAFLTEEDMEFVVDGEVVSGVFNETVSAVRKKAKQAVDAIFLVFEVLTKREFDSPDEDGYCVSAGPLVKRRERLDIFPIGIVDDLINPAGRPPVLAMPHVTVCSVEEIHHFYAKWQALGLEGAMVKLRDAHYRKDRDYGWMKLKAEKSVDLPIVGAEPGKAGTKYADTLGALVVDYQGVNVSVSGMSDKLRAEMWAAYQHDLAHPEEGPQLLGRLAEILYHEVTPDGSLRHPRFKRFRDDKPRRA